MSFVKSLADNLSDTLSPAIRKITDIYKDITGTKAQVLRIKKVSEDLRGDVVFEYQSEIINNVTINLPFSSVEIFGETSIDSTSPDYRTSALDITELLPVVMEVPFSGQSEEDAVDLDNNDTVVYVPYDSKQNPIPIRMQVKRMYEAFYLRRNVVKRKYELSLIRGTMEQEIEDKINEYISGQAVP